MTGAGPDGAEQGGYVTGGPPDIGHISALWSARREPVEQCAARLHAGLVRLSEISALFETWKGLGRSEAEARNRDIAIDEASLRRRLLAGRIRTDVGHEVIDELGFSFSAWSDTVAPVGISVTFGGYSEWVMNSLQIDLPLRGDGQPAADDLYELPTALECLRAVASNFEPGWATFSSSAIREVQPWRLRQPTIGWLTYLSDASLGDARSRLTELESEQVDGLGNIYIAAPSWPAMTPDLALALLLRLDPDTDMTDFPPSIDALPTPP